MPQANLRTVTAKDRPHIKRGVLYLSNGYEVVIAPDTNAFGIYISSVAMPTGVASGDLTLVRNITTDISATGNQAFSACIDANDGLHVVWHSANYNIKYWYAPYSGGTYGAGTTTTLSTDASNYPDSVDIDCPGLSGKAKYTVVSVQYGSGSSNATFLRCFVIDDTGPTVYTYTSSSTTTGTGGLNRNKVDTSVQCSKNTDPTTAASFNFAVSFNKSAGTNDLGDVVRTFTFSTSSHSITAVQDRTLSTAGKAAGIRKYWMFSNDASNTYYLVGAGGTNFWLAYKFTVNADGTITDLSPVAINTAAGSNMLSPKYGVTLYFGVAFHPGSGRAVIFAPTSANGYTQRAAMFNSDNSISWDTSNYRWVWGQTNQVVTCGYSGAARNYQSHPGACFGLAGSAGSVYTLVTTAILGGTAPVTKPSGGSTVNTSFPLLEARFSLISYPLTKYKVGWMISQDSGFATGVITVIQPDSQFTLPIGTQKGGGIPFQDIRTSMVSTQRIPQGFWYAKAIVIDQFGNQTIPSGATSSFTIAHPPAYSSPSPASDEVVNYSSSGAVFNWNFTDSSPGDAQTQYQIDITRTSDGASVASSGLVASAVNSGTVAIAATYKDTELAWVLTVYDTDGVPSSSTAQNTFYVSDPPLPAITAPPTSPGITTGTPNVNWTNGVQGVKAQASWRILVLYSTYTILDTGWTDGTDLTYKIPPGILHNLTNYTVVLYIRDSIGQIGQTSSTFSTAYTPPVSVASFSLWQDRLESRGYIHVGWESTGYDTDFQYWTVYRQAIGESAPTALAIITELHASYGFRDYSAKANTQYSYWITQTVNRFGDQVESAPGMIIKTTAKTTRYWLLDSLSAVDPVPLYIVTDDSWTDEHEENVVNLIGRGRHVDIGTRWGKNGTLAVKFRDRYIGFQMGYNWLPNASLQYASDGYDPDGWTFTPHGTASPYTLMYSTFYEYSPNDKYSLYTMVLDSLGTTGADWMDIAAPRITVADTDWVTGTTVSYGMWLGASPSSSRNFNLKIKVDWYAADGVTNIGTSTQNATVAQVQNSQTTALSSGNWSRWVVQVNVPSGAVYCQVTYQFFATTTGSFTIALGGAMVNTGSTILSMFDGDCMGCTWTKYPGSGSYCSGVYSARQQRLDLQDIKELERSLYLLNPFGDSDLVSIGDEANQRIAGVGALEFDDLTIPYREVVS